MASSLKNTENGYGWVAIALHWLVAVAVFAMFGLGLYMIELTYYDAWYKGSLDLHKSAGILMALTVLIRFVWRLINPSPKGLSPKPLENLAAHLAHGLLYLMMAALFISGYLISTADGQGIAVFELFTVPATLSADHQEDIAGDVHRWLAWGLMGLVGLHALAALKHHFLNRDATLKRMLRSQP